MHLTFWDPCLFYNNCDDRENEAVVLEFVKQGILFLYAYMSLEMLAVLNSNFKLYVRGQKGSII